MAASKPLKGRIAVVTGASRGGGRGIALSLGEAGATVYVTGRSVRGDTTRPDLAGATVDDTAEDVTTRGGVGIPVRCDHTRDDEVAALFDRIEREGGVLDLLVNNVWGGYEDYDEAFTDPFWEQPASRWDGMFSAGVRAHWIASQHAARLMVSRGSGLIASTTFWDRGKSLSSLPYDLAKNAVNRLAYEMALELKSHGVASVAVSPGWMRTEAVLAAYGLPIDDSVRELPPELEQTESILYVGRAVAALASDAKVLEKTGRILTVGDLAREYGFTDVDGSQPPPYRLLPEHTRD